MFRHWHPRPALIRRAVAFRRAREHVRPTGHDIDNVISGWSVRMHAATTIVIRAQNQSQNQSQNYIGTHQSMLGIATNLRMLRIRVGPKSGRTPSGTKAQPATQAPHYGPLRDRSSGDRRGFTVPIL